MSFNLIETIKSLFNNNLISNSASSLGESEGGIQKALGGIVPLILSGVVAKAGSGDAGGILGMVKNAAAGGGVLNSLRGMLDGGPASGSVVSKGMDMLRGLFGGNTGAVSNAISNYAGIKESSANSLLGLAAPVTLGKLGEHAVENNMDASSFSSFLSSQKSNILSAMPSGLSLASIPGLGSLGALTADIRDRTTDVRSKTVETANYTRDRDEVKTGGTNWLWPVLLILAAALAAWYFLGRGCNSADTTVTDDTTTTMTTPLDSDTVTTTTTTLGNERTSTKVRLADGTEIDAYTGGVEDQLVNCLNDASCTAGKDKWFDFDNLNFETGSAKLTAESQQQVNNIAAVLKAYSKAKIKIGGYTDKTGDAATNKQLSQQRADAVLSAIKAGGANASQLEGAEGYGSEFATVDASASDEERRKDRRIAVQLREK